MSAAWEAMRSGAPHQPYDPISKRGARVAARCSGAITRKSRPAIAPRNRRYSPNFSANCRKASHHPAVSLRLRPRHPLWPPFLCQQRLYHPGWRRGSHWRSRPVRAERRALHRRPSAASRTAPRGLGANRADYHRRRRLARRRRHRHARRDHRRGQRHWCGQRRY